MKLVKSMIFRLALVLFAGGAWGQTASLTLTVDDPRPLAAACDKIEELSGFAVNYEDGPYANAIDLRDVTDQVLTPNQRASAGPDFHIIVPRGGPLSATVPVQASNSKIGSLAEAQDAALAFVNANKSSGQVFHSELGNVALFVWPEMLKDASGNLQPVTPVLSAQISFPQASRTAFETLRLILQAVSQATGSNVDIGTIPIKGFAISKVNIGADKEPARSVIIRLFQAMITSNGANAALVPPTLSYRLFYGYNVRGYALNVHMLAGAMIPGPAISNGIQQPPAAPTAGQGQNPFFKTTHP